MGSDMSLTTYTTYAEVRSTLGLGDDELEDLDMALPIVNDWAIMQLEENFPNFEADFASLPPTPAGNYLRMSNLMRLAYTYTVARYYLQTIDNVAYNELTDGRTTVKRIATPLVASGINNTYNYVLRRMAKLYATIFPSSTTNMSTTTTVMSFIGSTGLAVDPVTGE